MFVFFARTQRSGSHVAHHVGSVQGHFHREGREDRARQVLVNVRTKTINSVRALTKSMGGRVPKCSGDSVHNYAADNLPDGLRATLEPLVAQIAEITGKIREYDAQLGRMAKKKYHETEVLRRIKGRPAPVRNGAHQAARGENASRLSCRAGRTAGCPRAGRPATGPS